MTASYKRSNAPIFWLLFGAGGMLSALLGPVLVALTAVAMPLGWMLAKYRDHGAALALMQHPLSRVTVLAVIVLFLWHAAHRLFKCLHDFGIHPSWRSKLACYGSALVFSLVALVFVVNL